MLTQTRMRALGILKIAISVLLLLGMQTYAEAGEVNKEELILPPRTELVPRIDGYGPYKFGMSIEQARKARPEAEKTDCGYINTAYCLTEHTETFGQEARIDVLFDIKTRRLLRINITFDRLRLGGKEGACKKVLEAIAEPLIQKWGLPSREDRGKFYWESVYGGSISLLRLCITENVGIVVVSYGDMPGF